MTVDIKDEWSVWLAYIRFSDGTGGKERPVVVLSDKVVLCICMGVTSKEKKYHHGYELKHWGYAGLKVRSWVRFEFLRVRPDLFKHRIGMLHEEDIQGIQEWLSDLSK